ncbi:unnamed protein product [Nesidiocoris tenuis]|uniref:Uncharacterized protein n=1 Tax=Nesidiocoris tenuis TaxID=355587 RepID=A0A6H5H2R5_9HEMI|nr:unnamed protein product [Nesidiocoris tenuis]
MLQAIVVYNFAKIYADCPGLTRSLIGGWILCSANYCRTSTYHVYQILLSLCITNRTVVRQAGTVRLDGCQEQEGEEEREEDEEEGEEGDDDEEEEEEDSPTPEALPARQEEENVSAQILLVYIISGPWMLGVGYGSFHEDNYMQIRIKNSIQLFTLYGDILCEMLMPFKAKTVGADLYEGLNSICPGQNSALHSEADCHSLIVIPLFRRLTGDLYHRFGQLFNCNEQIHMQKKSSISTLSRGGEICRYSFFVSKIGIGYTFHRAGSNNQNNLPELSSRYMHHHHDPESGSSPISRASSLSGSGSASESGSSAGSVSGSVKMRRRVRIAIIRIRVRIKIIIMIKDMMKIIISIMIRQEPHN